MLAALRHDVRLIFTRLNVAAKRREAGPSISMPLLLGIIGMFIPRVVIFILWFFGEWFTAVFETKLWPILGFIFLPTSVLWYSVVENWFAGAWNWWQVVIMVFVILGDLNEERKTARR